MADQQSPRKIPIIVPHSAYGDPECCGCIFPARRGDVAGLICNECNAVIQTVPVAKADEVLLKMSMALGVCSEVCPVCGELNTFTGSTSMEANTCRHCGNGIVVNRPFTDATITWQINALLVNNRDPLHGYPGEQSVRDGNVAVRMETARPAVLRKLQRWCAARESSGIPLP